MADAPMTFPGEIWKPVVDDRIDEPLEVSNIGRVKRIGRSYTVTGRPGVAPFQCHRPTRLAHILYPLGYPSVNIRKPDGKRISIGIHQLICGAFHGPRPSPRHQAAHRDGNPVHCVLSNVRWATLEENQADKKIHGTHIEGVDMHNAKLDDARVKEMRRLHAEGGFTYTDLAKKFGVYRTTAERTIKRRLWKHVA